MHFVVQGRPTVATSSCESVAYDYVMMDLMNVAIANMIDSSS